MPQEISHVIPRSIEDTNSAESITANLDKTSPTTAHPSQTSPPLFLKTQVDRLSTPKSDIHFPGDLRKNKLHAGTRVLNLPRAMQELEL